RLAVLEAMKMETQLVAPFSGRVRQVMTMPNVQVNTGAPLLQIEATSNGGSVSGRDRVVFGSSVPKQGGEASPPRCSENLQDLRQLMLGFDLDPIQIACQLGSWSET